MSEKLCFSEHTPKSSILDESKIFLSSKKINVDELLDKDKIKLIYSIKMEKLHILLFILVLFAVIFLIPLPYTVIETYTINESNSGYETYEEEWPYFEEKCETAYPKYSYKVSKSPEDIFGGDSLIITCEISNFENKSVGFNYRIYAYDCGTNKTFAEYYGKVFVDARKIEYEETSLSKRDNLCYDCEITTQKIEKCRTVTKLKNITRERFVVWYNTTEKERYVKRYAPLYKRLTGRVE